MGAAEEFQVLSPELRNKARRYRDSRNRQNASTSTNRRSLILGNVNDILSGTYHGSNTDDDQTGIEEDLMLKGMDGGGSLHSTRSRCNRTRYQRRGSCTKYNLEKISNHSSHNQSPKKIPRDGTHSSFGGKPASASKRPSSTPQQHTIDERPLPMKSSTHRRRLKDVKASMHMESSEHDDMSIASVSSFGDDTVGSERSHRTIDELPLPMKEIKSTKTPTTAGRRRQTTWLPPRSPGALMSNSTSTNHRSPGSLTCQRKSRRPMTSANGQQDAAAILSPVPVSPLVFDDDVAISPLSATIHDGSSPSQDSFSFSEDLSTASPPTKKIKSPKSSSGRKKVVKSTKSSSSRRKVSKAATLPSIFL